MSARDISPLLTARALSVGYRSGRRASTTLIAGPLDLELTAGRLVCLLGPNGSGKSTLLRTLAGLQPPLGGRIGLSDVDLSNMRPSDLAKKISLVLTDPVRGSNLTVSELVSLGRYPWSGWLGSLTPEDREKIGWAMRAAGVDTFAGRKLVTLSDGESQKVMLARALAQDTPLMMLDEPTAHLDLPSRIQLMQLLHRLVRHTGKSILVSTHELDLALQVADEVWLLREDAAMVRGVPEDLVLGGVFEEAFYKEGVKFDKATGTFHMQTDAGPQIQLIADGADASLRAATFWTRRALQRRGFSVMDDKSAPAHDIPSPTHRIVIDTASNQMRWRWEGAGSIHEFTSIGTLLDALHEFFFGEHSFPEHFFARDREMP